MNISRVRRAGPDETAQIRRVVTDAFATSEFGYNGEAELVDRLCSGCADAISLVAEVDGRLVGHILFTPVVIDSAPPCHGMGLAPLSVLPEFQGQGVGSELTRYGIEMLRGQASFVVVLGHPSFYRRFGFEQAVKYGVRTTFDVPDELFMIRILAGNAENMAGVASYRHEFERA